LRPLYSNGEFTTDISVGYGNTPELQCVFTFNRNVFSEFPLGICGHEITFCVPVSFHIGRFFFFFTNSHPLPRLLLLIAQKSGEQKAL
jgi:hypothetical protein